MSYKHVFRSAAREKVLRGAGQLGRRRTSEAGRQVKVGPHPAQVGRRWSAMTATSPRQKIPAERSRREPRRADAAAAERTGDVVGDGTSGSTVLAHAIFADGVRNVVAGASAIDLKRDLERAAKLATDTLKAMPKPVSTRKEKVQIAALSANNDDAIGEIGRRRHGEGRQRQRDRGRESKTTVPSRRRLDKSRGAPPPMVAWWWRAYSRTKAITASTPHSSATSIWWRPASSIRRKSSALRWRTPCQWRGYCC
jgi:hypothetical protein